MVCKVRNVNLCKIAYYLTLKQLPIILIQSFGGAKPNKKVAILWLLVWSYKLIFVLSQLVNIITQSVMSNPRKQASRITLAVGLFVVALVLLLIGMHSSSGIKTTSANAISEEFVIQIPDSVAAASDSIPKRNKRKSQRKSSTPKPPTPDRNILNEDIPTQ